MEERSLQEMTETGPWTVLFVLSITSVSIPCGLILLLTSLWTEKVKSSLLALISSAVRGVVVLQSVGLFAYATPGWTSKSYDYLRSAESWVWFDYFDSLIDDKIDNPTQISPPNDLKNFDNSHWSEFYLRNSFTSLGFWTFSLLFCVFSILLNRFKPAITQKMPIFRPDLFIFTYQLVHFRLVLSLFIEIRLIQSGKDYDWSFFLCIFLSFFTLILFPISELLYLRLKARGNLESDTNLWYFGATYRDYKKAGQVFHFHSVLVEQVGLGLAVGVLGQWEDLQPYVIFAICLLTFLYTAISRPYLRLIDNLDQISSLFLRLLFSIFLVLVFNDSQFDISDDMQSLTCFLVIFLWLVVRNLCGLWEIWMVIKMIRGFVMQKETGGNKTALTEKSIGSILKTSSSEDLQLSKRRIKKQEVDVSDHGDPTARSDMLDSTPPAKDSLKDDIDPRLERRTPGRRRRKKKVSIPA